MKWTFGCSIRNEAKYEDKQEIECFTQKCNGFSIARACTLIRGQIHNFGLTKKVKNIFSNPCSNSKYGHFYKLFTSHRGDNNFNNCLKFFVLKVFLNPFSNSKNWPFFLKLKIYFSQFYTSRKGRS